MYSRLGLLAAPVIVCSIIVLLIGACRSSEIDNVLINAQQQHVPNVAPQSCCTKKDPEPKSFVFVSTLDGRINAVSTADGALLWSLVTDSEPLLSSTLGNIPFFSGESEFRLIPSLDGHLYMYNDASMQAIPVNVDDLLSSSLKLGSDVIAGGKQTRTYAVDYKTGTVRYVCGSSGCENFVDENSPTLSPSSFLIKRITQTVRAVDAVSGAERWNVTIGSHELMFNSKPPTSDECACEPGRYPANKWISGEEFDDKDYRYCSSNTNGDVILKIVPPQGLLLAYSKCDPDRLIWEKQFDHPIVQLWTLENNDLVEKSIFDPSLVPAFSYYAVVEDDFAEADTGASYAVDGFERIIYIGTYRNQKYVIVSPEERKKMKELTSYKLRDTNRIYLVAPATSQSQVTDQSQSCDQDCPTCTSEEVNSLILRDQFPRDMGWYLYKHRITDVPKPLRPRKGVAGRISGWIAGTDGKNFIDRLMTNYFWLLMLCCLAAVSIPAILVAYIYRTKLIELNAKYIMAKALKGKTTIVHVLSTEGTPSNQSEGSNRVLAELAADMTGKSYGRFAMDFEPRRLLGKGGFGVVVESRNKHDDQLYAVKRISFVAKNNAKERVRREVRALAQLDHPGIVRYFSAWFEEPPADWQQEADRDIFKKCEKPISDEITLTESSRAIGEHGDQRLDLKEKSILRPLSGGDNATFGTWSASEIASNDGVPLAEDSIGDQLMAPRLHQDSIEIIFAHSTTGMPTSSFPRKKRKSSSSKNHSITKSDDDQSREEKIKVFPLAKAYLYIQMQLCHGTLKDWLVDNDASESRVRPTMLDWFDQLVCAMQYVHELGLIHRDLKPSNIFFSVHGQLKIGDFGLVATTLPTDPVSESQDGIPTDNGLLEGNALLVTVSPMSRSDRAGTQLYMSPEQEIGKKCTSKADIYALGLIFVELLYAFKTHMERVTVLRDLRRNVFSTDFEEHPDELVVAKRLLDHDPTIRPTCVEIREMGLFSCCRGMRPLVASYSDLQAPGRTFSKDSIRTSSSS